jgi:hypothetical protein
MPAGWKKLAIFAIIACGIGSAQADAAPMSRGQATACMTWTDGSKACTGHGWLYT